MVGADARSGRGRSGDGRVRMQMPADFRYILVGVTASGALEELQDDARRLQDIDFLQPVVKLVEASATDESEKQLVERLNKLVPSLAASTGDHDNEDIEVFRADTAVLQHEVAVERALMVEDLWTYAPSLVFPPVPQPPSAAPIQLAGVWPGVAPETTVQVDSWDPPEAAIVKLWNRWNRSRIALPRPASELAIRAYGRCEFLLGSHPLVQYRYVQQTLMAGERAVRVEVQRNPARDRAGVTAHGPYLRSSCSPSDIVQMYAERAPKARPKPPAAGMTTADMPQKLCISIDSALDVSITDADGIYVSAGIFHGVEMICPPLRTAAVAPAQEPSWNEAVTFDVAIKVRRAEGTYPHNASAVCRRWRRSSPTHRELTRPAAARDA